MKPVSFIRTSPQALGEEGHDGGYKNPLSLDELIVRHPTSTFFARVGDDIETNEAELLGVGAGDILVIDRAVSPRLGHLVLSVINGELALRRFTEHGSRRFLVSGTGDSLECRAEADVLLWGVVTAVTRLV